MVSLGARVNGRALIFKRMPRSTVLSRLMICGILPFSFIADFWPRGGGGGVGETLRLLKAINPKLNTLFGKEDKIHAFFN